VLESSAVGKVFEQLQYVVVFRGCHLLSGHGATDALDFGQSPDAAILAEYTRFLFDLRSRPVAQHRGWQRLKEPEPVFAIDHPSSPPRGYGPGKGL
jgi:hypothetical protein